VGLKKYSDINTENIMTYHHIGKIYDSTLSKLKSSENSSQISTKMRMSKATWLLFLDTKLPLEEFFFDIDIPFDCEFLVAQGAGGHAVLLTEVYRVKATLPLLINIFGTWTSPGGLTWPNMTLYQRRDNLRGISLRTGFVKVSMLACSCTYD
jgi:hypothetical protein